MTNEKFQEYCEISFGEKNINIIPSNVILIYDDEQYSGFLDINITAVNSCYLRYMGFAKFSYTSWAYLKEAFEYLKSKGMDNIFGTIHSNNALSLLHALRLGFVVNGFKVVSGIGFVEIIRTPETMEKKSFKRGL